MTVPGHVHLGLTGVVGQRQRENARAQVVQVQISPQPGYFALARLKCPHRSTAPQAFRSEDRVNALVGAHIENGHAWLKDAIEKGEFIGVDAAGDINLPAQIYRKSTRLNSSHLGISY